jgi:predicted dehydrogenase
MGEAMFTAENRRVFLKSAAATALSQSRVLGANERVRIGAIGTGGRCRYLLTVLGQIGGSELAAVCDVYEPRRVEIRQSLAPGAREYLDYRELLGRSDIDAVVIGSPDHWHVPMTVDAVSAGKDVYVEKPVSHSIEEGEVLRKAVEASGRVVQTGYQQRSWEHFRAGREIVASGKLGRISLILTSWYQNYLRNAIVAPKMDPGKVDWKSWLGSAPNQPFDALRYAHWRWFWDFGGGHLTDLYSHWVDTIHWYMGFDTPLAAQAMGDRHAIPMFDCPETINACYQYPGDFSVVYNGMLVGSLEGGNIIIRGSRGMMKLNRDGLAVYREGVVPSERTTYPPPETQIPSAGDGTREHLKNFLDCVRSRSQPNAGIAAAVAAARAAHIGNIGLRKGARVTWPMESTGL